MFHIGKRSAAVVHGKKGKLSRSVVQDSEVIENLDLSDSNHSLSSINRSDADGKNQSLESACPVSAVVSADAGSNRARFMLQNKDVLAPECDTGAVHSSPGGGAVVMGDNCQSSPGGNRARFMANCQPLKVSCDLSAVGMHNTGSRFSFQAVVLIVYPASVKPERRHVQLIDARGSTGLTVWNEHVSFFSQSSVGQVVRFTKLAVVHQNGQKSLTMGRDSTITFLAHDVTPTDESIWWKSLLAKPPIRIIDVYDCEDNTLVNVSGIVGTLFSETKRVRNEDKQLLCMRITDRSGCIDVRSWNHCEVEFAQFREQPILFKRVRITSFAGNKILELLDASGTEVFSEFAGKSDLASYWRE